MPEPSATSRLLRAIGYPEEVTGDSAKCILQVDNGEITASDDGSRLVLRASLMPCGEESAAEKIQTLVGFAAGRMLRESAVLAYDPQADAVILWQATNSHAGPMALRAFFEQFTASWDWWRERVTELESPTPTFPEVMFRP